jgi:hypothetical protein
MVEFALVLPLVLLVLFGMIDLGKAFNYWNDETHLANEGARFAAVNNSPQKDGSGNPIPGSLNAAIKNQADSQELRDKVNVLICFPTGSTGQLGQTVMVTLDATYDWMPYIAILNLNKHMRASSTMRLEKAYAGDGSDAYTINSTYSAADKRCEP